MARSRGSTSAEARTERKARAAGAASAKTRVSRGRPRRRGAVREKGLPVSPELERSARACLYRDTGRCAEAEALFDEASARARRCLAEGTALRHVHVNTSRPFFLRRDVERTP